MKTLSHCQQKTMPALIASFPHAQSPSWKFAENLFPDLIDLLLTQKNHYGILNKRFERSASEV